MRAYSSRIPKRWAQEIIEYDRIIKKQMNEKLKNSIGKKRWKIPESQKKEIKIMRSKI